MSEYFTAFKNAYHLPESEWAPELWKESATCLQEAFSILSRSLTNAPNKEELGLYLRIAENCIGRLYETSSSMIASIACGATSGVESLARVIIEGSWTTRYIVEGDFKKRMFAYLFQYLREHPIKLAEWKRLIEEQRPGDAVALSAVNGRSEFINEMYTFFDQLRDSADQPEVDELMKHWPRSLFKRCESIGETEKYYTHYHRLSADSHQNAEQTMQYLFGYFIQVETGLDALDRIGLETVHYSAMMAALAIDEAIVAAIAACDTFDAQYPNSRINEIRERLRKTADRLSTGAGAPI